MLFSEMNEEQKAQFFEEQEARVAKLRAMRPGANMDNIISQKDAEMIKEAKKRKARELYWNYHKKSMNSPDRRKKLGD